MEETGRDGGHRVLLPQEKHDLVQRHQDAFPATIITAEILSANHAVIGHTTENLAPMHSVMKPNED